MESFKLYASIKFVYDSSWEKASHYGGDVYPSQSLPNRKSKVFFNLLYRGVFS